MKPSRRPGPANDREQRNHLRAAQVAQQALVIEQQARVVQVTDGFVTVEMGGQTGCPACDAGQGCGAGLFGRLLRRAPVRLSLPRTGTARTGAAVVLGLPESVFLRLVARLYALPLLAGLGAAAMGHVLAGYLGAGPGLSDLAVLISGVLGAGLALKFRRADSRPDISLNDIEWLDSGAVGPGCQAVDPPSTE